MSQTIAESFIEEGEIKGLIKGEIKGEIKGKLEARRDDLQRLLQWRFPSKYNESTVARIRAADNPAVLEQWFSASLNAESWNDFQKLAGWPKSNGDHDNGA